MNTDLISCIGLAVLILIWVFVRKITRKNPAASKRITIPQAILLVLGSALLVLLMILFLKDIGQKTWYFWAPI